eukprot:316150-Pleurochrysis_carterae.AAC.1
MGIDFGGGVHGSAREAHVCVRACVRAQVRARWLACARACAYACVSVSLCVLLHVDVCAGSYARVRRCS